MWVWYERTDTKHLSLRATPISQAGFDFYLKLLNGQCYNIMGLCVMNVRVCVCFASINRLLEYALISIKSRSAEFPLDNVNVNVHVFFCAIYLFSTPMKKPMVTD